jgi:predicted ATP-binding protein involved in virulence
MFLRELELTNVRCFKRIRLDFAAGDALRKWTILLGENGTGKSTILRAAAAITCGSDALAEVLGDPQAWIRTGADSCTIRAVLQVKTGQTRDVSLTVSRGEKISSVVSRSLQTLKPLNDAVSHAERNYFVAGYGASRRLAGKDAQSSNRRRFVSRRANAVATLFDREATLNPLEAWATDLHYREEAKGLATVKRVLSQFLPTMKFHSIDRAKRQILMRTADGIVPLTELSDGYQNVAAWVGDLLFQIAETFADYRTPLNTRGLLIIDELDLHLHPGWQRYLHQFLSERLPNLQLLVTTHSVVTAQQANENELHYLKRDGKAVGLHMYAGDPGKLLINQLLMSEVFGIESDEALSVEQEKDQYRALRDKPRKSAGEKQQLTQLATKLRSRPAGGSSNIRLHSEQVKLLREVKKELAQRK